MSHKAAKRQRQEEAAARRVEVRDILKFLMTKLRLIYAKRLKDERKRWPGQRLPCESCAFRTSTDTWPGFEKTVISFIRALAQDQVFYCHQKMIEPEDGGEYIPTYKKLANGMVVPAMDPCAAWFTFMSNPPFHLSEMGLTPQLIDEIGRQDIFRNWCEPEAGK